MTLKCPVTLRRAVRWWSQVAVALALAQPLTAPAQFAFAVSPPRFELSAQPGARLRQTIEINNVSSRTSPLLIRTADWERKPDDSVAFFDDLMPGSCRPWVAIERRELAVPPRRPYRFRFEVSVPADAAPTECRFAIMLEGKDTAFGGPGESIPIAARVAVVVYVAVGDARPELQVLGAQVEMREGQPTPVLQVRNAGNAHGRLDGFLTGTDATGRTLDVAPSNSPIFPGETRSIPLNTLGQDQQPVQPSFPLRVTGSLEWGRGRSTEVDQQFTR